MRPRKQPSLDELFQLYPQLRMTAPTAPLQDSQMPPAFLREGAKASESSGLSSHYHGEQN